MADDQLNINITASTSSAALSVKDLAQGFTNLGIAANESGVGARNLAAALAQVASETTRASTNIQNVAEETHNLNFATSGAIQEYIRLGHEAMTGNFSRMPGSLVVLMSRFGELDAATLGYMATIGLTAGAVGYLTYQFVETEIATNKLENEMLALGQDAIAANLIPTLSTLHDVMGLTKKDAEAFTEELGRIRGVTPDTMVALSNSFGELSIGAKGAKPAIDFLNKALTEKKMTLEELTRVFPNVSSQELISIRTAQEAGDVNKIVLATLKLLDEEYKSNIDLQTKLATKREDVLKSYYAMPEVISAENTELLTNNKMLEEATNKLAAYHWAVTQMGKPGAIKLVDPDELKQVFDEVYRNFAYFDNLVEQSHKERAQFDHAEWEQSISDANEANKAYAKMVTDQTRIDHEAWLESIQQTNEHNNLVKRDLEQLHHIMEKMDQDTLDKKFAADVEYFHKAEQLERKAAQEHMQQKTRELQEMLGAERSFVSNVLSGRMTLGGALMQLSGQVIEKEIEDDLAYLTAKLLMNDEEMAAEGTKASAGFLLHKLLALANIGTDAAVAGAGTTAHDAPIIGPASLGTGAAVAGAVAALAGSLPSFAIGSLNVPQDMVANIHKGEMIIPARQADAMRSGAGTTINIHCIDAAGVHAFVRANAGAIAKGVSEYQRFNPDSRPSY